MPKLVFINKNFEEQEYELMVEKTTVGRANHNTLVICDPSVSAAHCEILMNGPEIIVRDLDSSNGTFVDGVRLNKQSQAKSGQVVRIGLVEARLELEPEIFDERSTSITAVVDMGKYQREKRREEKKLQTGGVEGKVEPSAGVVASSEGHTVLIPRPKAPAPAPIPKTDTEIEGAQTKKWIVPAVVVLVLILAALAWVFLKGK